MGEGTDTFRVSFKGKALADWFLKSVREVGFPIAVASYFILGLSPKLDKIGAFMERVAVALERDVRR